MPPADVPVGRAPSPGRGRVPRFDRIERAAHWLTALLFIVLAVTGAILYIPSLANAVRRRLFIEDLHLYTGIAVFVPLGLSAAGPWGRQLRRDLAGMNRFSRAEYAWLRTFGREGRRALSKFNPGQKLNTFAVAGLLMVLWGTGLVLRYANFVAVTWRTGATFVHDWSALALAVLVLAHILQALAHPSALRSMIVGWVPQPWAERHAPTWLATFGTPQSAAAAAPPTRRSRAPGTSAAARPRARPVAPRPPASRPVAPRPAAPRPAAPAGGADPWAPVATDSQSESAG